jgi:hypothetical protein
MDNNDFVKLLKMLVAIGTVATVILAVIKRQ